MPEQVAGTEVPTPAGQTPPVAGAAHPAPADGAHDGLRKSLEGGNIEDTMKMILDLRKEAESHRKAAESATSALAKTKTEIEAQQAEAERAKLSELERLQADLKTAKDEKVAMAASLELERMNLAIIGAVTAAGLKPHNMADVVQFIDRTGIKPDADGQLAGMADALTALFQSRGYLFDTKQAAKVAPAGPTFIPGRTPAGAELIEASLKGKGTPEHNALKDQLHRQGIL